MPERGEEKGQIVYHNTHPGDLGMRPATWGKAPGLTRAQVAAPTAMAITHLACIEENPAVVMQVCPVRLAYALETTTTCSLLGTESARSSADLVSSGSAAP